MKLEELEAMIERFPGAESGYPFGPGAQVWKVGGKMFALLGEDDEPPRVSLKCDPDLALELREEFPANVTPGYHMNKRHWNTVVADDQLPVYEIEDWLGHSYELVVGSLPKRVRDALVE